MNLTLGTLTDNVNFIFNLYNFRNKGLTVQGMLGAFNSFGVYTSGGLDSTIMLCVLLDELKKMDRLEQSEVICFTVCKTSGSTFYADRIVKLLSKKFNKKLKHVSNIDNPFIHQIPTPLRDPNFIKITKEYPNTLFFTGLNAYPENKSELFTHDEYSVYDNEFMRNLKIINPFSNLFKFHILDLYFKLGYQDIIPYTHSCTKDPIGVCNNCTGCEERAWAFKVLGKEDKFFIPPDVEDITFGGTYKYIDGKAY